MEWIALHHIIPGQPPSFLDHCRPFTRRDHRWIPVCKKELRRYIKSFLEQVSLTLEDEDQHPTKSRIVNRSIHAIWSIIFSDQVIKSSERMRLEGKVRRLEERYQKLSNILLPIGRDITILVHYNGECYTISKICDHFLWYLLKRCPWGTAATALESEGWYIEARERKFFVASNGVTRVSAKVHMKAVVLRGGVEEVEVPLHNGVEVLLYEPLPEELDHEACHHPLEVPWKSRQGA